MLGLRTAKGIDIQKFNEQFNADFKTEYKNTLAKKGKYLQFNGDNLKIKDEYLFVQNDIIMDFMK